MTDRAQSGWKHSRNEFSEEPGAVHIMHSMLIPLFERAYLLLHDARMSPEQAPRWASWEDYMIEWCGRRDFRACLPEFLRGEDPEFGAYIASLRARAVEAI